MKRSVMRSGAVLLAILLLFAGCGSDDPTESAETPTTADSTAVTDTDGTGSETDPDAEWPDSGIALSAQTLTATETGVTLRFDVDIVDAPAEERLIALVLTDGKGEIASETLTSFASEMSVSLSCPADRLTGELTLNVTATVDGHVTDELCLKMKNGLPQLTPDGVRCVLAAMTLEEKANLVTGNPDLSKENASGGTYPIERLGVPATLFMDGTAGIRYDRSVWYPSVMNVSSSWDPALAARVGEALGKDALAHGFDIVLAPGINIQKNVLCGRNFEYASEDPILAGLMIAPYVNGIESTGAGTALKHYAVNNQETARGSVSANLTERALREIYLKAFGIVVADAQPTTIMSSYNRVNGTYSAVNGDLINGILRQEFGFAGMVMSDWGASGEIQDKILAGNDINMPGWEDDVQNVITAYQTGILTDESLNAACYHILTMVANSATAQDLDMNTRVNFEDHGKVSANTAVDSMVLLQNRESALPLSEETTVAVFGNASVRTFFGGFGAASVTPKSSVSVLKGLDAHQNLNVINMTNNPFLDCAEHDAFDASKDVEVTETYAQEMANEAEVAVIVIGRNSIEGTDSPAGKGGFRLNDTEAAMIERVSNAFHSAGKRVIVLLNTGSPIEVVSWRDSVDAILWMGYPGQAAGTAVAQVLTGEVNPSAKTTITWPMSYTDAPDATYFPGSADHVTYYDDIYVGYRYYETFDVDVAYPFGYGLSYTTFAYSDFSVTAHQDGTVRATVTVQNTGAVPGREVVELYVTKPETLQEQPALELCGFAKTGSLAAGESETVTIDVRAEALMTYDTEESRWLLDQGSYTYRVGASSEDLRGTATVSLAEAQILMDVENRCEPTANFEYIRKETHQVPEVTRTNLLLEKTITSNYDESEDLVAAYAVDGDYVTRWSGLGLSASSAYHTLDIDIGTVVLIGEFRIVWESVSAPFTVLYSADGETYTTHGTYLDDGSCRTNLNLYGAEARYIRLQILRGGQYTSIFEIEAYEATEADIEAGKNQGGEESRINLALGKPVTVSSVEGAHVAANAADGDITTRWSSLPSGEGWIVLDLEETVDISAVQIALESAWVPYFVEYSSDGENYTVLTQASADQLLIDLKDLSVKARYIRVRRDGSNWFSIYDIFVYGA